MNDSTAKVQSVIENTFTTAIEKLTQSNPVNLISDIYIQVDRESGELQIYDDTEKLLEKVVIFNWIGTKDSEEHFLKKISASIKAVLTVLSTKKVFDNDIFLKPLSINLVNEDYAVIEELLFLDDDMFRLDDPLLKDLDSELDDFLNRLLSDID